MNLTKLFEAQKKLREHINYNGEDRFEKLILALLVELGECANEQRSWKFWSKNQEPRKEKRIKCPTCNGTGMISMGEGIRGVKICPDCDNPKGGLKTVHPLLEEYVDGLHFVLELAIEMELEIELWKPEKATKEDITTQFIYITSLATGLWDNYFQEGCWVLLEYYLGLGEMLGFTWEQIEQAYFDKNAVNHQRQENGY